MQETTISYLEASLLSSLLWRPELTATAMHHIPADLWSCQQAFQDSSLREVADCVLDCWNSRRPSTPQNVISAAMLHQYRRVEETCRDLMSASPGESEATLERTAQDLAGEIRKARLSYLLSRASVLLTSNEPAEKVIAEALLSINSSVGSGLNIVSAAEGFRDMSEQYAIRKSGGGQALGIPTGLENIDRIVGGIPTGAVSIIGARPSQGKTALAGCIALHAAIWGFPVIFFSHEMASRAIFQRIVAVDADVSFSHLRNGRLSSRGERKVQESVSKLGKLDFSVIDTGDPHPADCRTTAMYLINKWGNKRPPLIVVDYIQLESLHNAKPDFRTQELAQISRYWCETAKILNAGVLLLSQLNRDAAGSQPNMSQLRDCGGLEQDATAIMLLWRPAKERKKEDEDNVSPGDRRKAGYNWGLLSVAKSRNSDLTEQELHFSGYSMAFRDWNASDSHLTKSEMFREELNRMMADIINASGEAPDASRFIPKHQVEDEDVPQF